MSGVAGSRPSPGTDGTWTPGRLALAACPGSGDPMHDAFLDQSRSSLERIQAVGATIGQYGSRFGDYTHADRCVFPLVSQLVCSDPTLNLRATVDVLARAGWHSTDVRIPGQGWEDFRAFWEYAAEWFIELVGAIRPSETELFREAVLATPRGLLPDTRA